MEDITTIDLQQYIKKDPFLDKKQEIWLHNLPEENKKLFNIIELLRKEYNNETFVITQNINITNEKINKEINFSNCIFENKISFENCIFNNSVCFTNSTFKNDVCFKKCTFIDNPFFNYSCENVIFEGENIDFSNSDFYNANFSNTIFGKNKKTLISFEGAKLSNTFFKKAKFKGKILFNKSEIENGRITEIQNTKFNEAIFFDQANFQEVIFLGSISFEKTQFKGDTFFNKTSFYNDNQNLEKEVIQVNFKHALFSKKVFFRDSKFGIKENGLEEDNYDIEILFKNAKFQKGVDFYKAIFYCPIYFSNAKFCLKEKIYSKYAINFEKAQFKKKVNFHYSEFYNTVRFENTKFENLVDFYSAHFYNAQQFHFTDFLDRAIFSNTEFDEEVQFLHCRVESNSYIRFEGVIFKKSLDISRSNFNDKANFWNIELEEEDAFTSSIYQNDFKVHKNEINSEKTVPSVYKQLRETYRIIKSNFYSQNNKIEGLKFYEKEMSVYLEEKRAEDKNPIKIIPLKKILYPIAKLSAIREKHNRIYDVIVIASNLIMYMFFVYKQSYTYFWILFLEAFIYVTSLLYQKKKDIKNTIKQNNYISLIVLLASMFLLFIPIYNVIPKKDTDNDYICLFIEWISSLLRSGYEYIIPYSLPFIAIFLMVSFLRREKLLLWFNKNSNEFGGNWVAGINFTIFVVLITYSFILLPISCNLKFSLTSAGVSNFLKSLVDILNLTDWNEMTIFGEKLTNWQYIFLFIGRIFVAYGVYQTIQAFRKFGKS